MTAGQAVVAAFDVDGTLTTTDCFRRFLRLLGGRGALVRGPLRQPLAMVRAAVVRDRDIVKAAVVDRNYRGRLPDEVDELGRAFAATIERELLRADTVARLRWHQDQGHRTVLVSASLASYLRPLGSALGVDGVLCTDVAVGADGRYTGVIAGRNCRGAEKVARLRGWLDGAGVDVVQVWAYGDSAGDRELLRFADHPTRVTRATLAARPVPR